MRKQSGLTLLELLISVAIISILITVVAPNVREMLITNRVISQINELSATIQYARSVAVNERTTTIVCPTSNFSVCSNNWSEAKMVFNDLNGNGSRDSDEEILAGTEINENILITTGPAQEIRFNQSGATASPATLKVCHNSNEAKFARAVVISLQGRVKTSRDTDNDGIYEDNAGTALSCP
ncbi:GspH/FimT family pseudopilin [Neptunicella marina]|uniref:Type II secretion system protein H n=1 Tax=Neptunicella marina TaxID=2125989 RepID=A0A8J6ITQ1_9ALTE|nr:GspH/FimT family pseudopilin [Neptunicella marina]MBC3765446.1 GspH/FimT family pseudopilin [Neptunicella marina]